MTRDDIRKKAEKVLVKAEVEESLPEAVDIIESALIDVWNESKEDDAQRIGDAIKEIYGEFSPTLQWAFKLCQQIRALKLKKEEEK